MFESIKPSLRAFKKKQQHEHESLVYGQPVQRRGGPQIAAEQSSRHLLLLHHHPWASPLDKQKPATVSRPHSNGSTCEEQPLNARDHHRTYQIHLCTAQCLQHRPRDPLEQIRAQVFKLLPGNLGFEVNIIQEPLDLVSRPERKNSTHSYYHLLTHVLFQLLLRC